MIIKWGIDFCSIKLLTDPPLFGHVLGISIIWGGGYSTVSFIKVFDEEARKWGIVIKSGIYFLFQ